MTVLMAVMLAVCIGVGSALICSAYTDPPDLPPGVGLLIGAVVFCALYAVAVTP